jgi:hypothetical protein
VEHLPAEELSLETTVLFNRWPAGRGNPQKHIAMMTNHKVQNASRRLEYNGAVGRYVMTVLETTLPSPFEPFEPFEPFGGCS